ncbi:MAG: DUF47 family protein [Syntrophomonadaceae bacterium]
MLFNFKRNNPYDYIRAFARLSDYSVQAAEYLDKCFQEFSPEKMPQMLVQMHEIEHNADAAKDFMVKKLVREFLPPFDKDDIMFLAHQIDTVTEAIEEVLIFIDVRQIREIPPAARQFSDLIVKCCQTMNMALGEMKDYKTSVWLPDHLAAVNRMKKEGKDLHGSSIKKIHQGRRNPVLMVNCTGLFNCLERCTNNCKEVTNTVERMAIRYS